uniref:PPUP8885 n=1 Tax=Poeciliopsis prolifica TaxID=188132 RepID=A0A0S7ENW6_9TELE
MAMTVDRFCTVVLNKMRNNNQRKKQYAIGVCVVVWVISIGISVYDAFKMELSDDYYCEVLILMILDIIFKFSAFFHPNCHYYFLQLCHYIYYFTDGKQNKTQSSKCSFLHCCSLYHLLGTIQYCTSH